MGNVISIHSHRTFTQEDAESILPVVRRITERAAADASEINEQIRFVPDGEPLHNRLQMQLNSIIRHWAIKISKLGATPRGVWLVDFDAGDGWFSWRHGDETLSFFHPYGDAKGRELIGIDSKLLA